MALWYALDENRQPYPLYRPPSDEVMVSDARRVASTDIGDVGISTVFLWLNHSFGSGPPLLFETMVFGGEHDGYQERYATWGEALEGHGRAVRMVTDASSA